MSLDVQALKRLDQARTQGEWDWRVIGTPMHQERRLHSGAIEIIDPRCSFAVGADK